MLQGMNCFGSKKSWRIEFHYDKTIWCRLREFQWEGNRRWCQSLLSGSWFGVGVWLVEEELPEISRSQSPRLGQRLKWYSGEYMSMRFVSKIECQKNRIKRKGGRGERRKESLNGNKGRSEWNERKHGKRWEKSERKWKKVDNKNMGILFTTYRLMVVFVLLLAWRRIRIDFWSPAPTHTSAGVEHHNNSILVCI